MCHFLVLPGPLPSEQFGRNQLHRERAAPASSADSARARASGVLKFAVCVDNDGYEASLELNKIYVVLRDKDAERDGDLRIVGESGDDYLFSGRRFVAIEVAAAVKASLLKGS